MLPYSAPIKSRLSAAFNKLISTHCTSQQFYLIVFNNTPDLILVISDHSLIFRVTIADAVTIQFDLLRMNIVLFETCRGL
jgi:hypothetical protein